MSGYEVITQLCPDCLTPAGCSCIASCTGGKKVLGGGGGAANGRDFEYSRPVPTLYNGWETVVCNAASAVTTYAICADVN